MIRFGKHFSVLAGFTLVFWTISNHAAPAARKTVLLRAFEPRRPPAEPRLARRIRASLSEVLRRQGYGVLVSDQKAPATNTGSDYVVGGTYSRADGGLILNGLLFDSRTGYVIDAHREADPLAAISDQIQIDERTPDAEIIQRFAEKIALRIITNPRRKYRRRNITEFLAESGLGRESLPLPPADTGADTEQAEVFQMLGQERVVTGTRIERPLKEVPATLRVVTAETIRRKRYRYLFELLRDQPGFDHIFFQGLYGSIFSQRGLDQPENLRTLIFIDGVLDNNISAGSAYIKHKYSLHNVKRVEILYGPASSLYGANAFTGVINMITKDGSDITGTLEYGFGSLYYQPPLGRPAPNANFNLGRRFGQGADAVSLILSGHWIDSEGPRINDRDQHDPTESTYYWTDAYTNSRLDDNYMVNLKGNWRGLTLGAWQARDYNGQGTFATGAAYSDDGTLSYWNTLTRTAYGKFETDLGSRLHEKFKISYRETGVTDGTDAEYSEFGDLPGEITITRYARPDSEISLENSVDLRWSRRNNTTLGVSLTDQFAWNYNTTDYTYDNIVELELLPFPLPPDFNPRNRYRYANRAGFVEHDWRFHEKASLTLGYRYDFFRITGQDGPKFCGTNEETLPDDSPNPNFISESNAALQGCILNDRDQYYSHFPVDKTYVSSNPRSGLTYSPLDRLTLKLLYGEAFRAPTVREMYSVSGSRITNENLNPEKTKTTEAGVIFHPLPNLKLDLAAYHSFVKDIILLAGTDIHRPGKGEGKNLSRFQNAGKAQVTGFDFGLEARPAADWTVTFNYTYQKSKLFDVLDPDLRAHDLNSDPGFEKNEGVSVCREVLIEEGYRQLQPLCGEYQGDMPRVAKHKFNLGTGLVLFDHLNLNLRANYVGERPNIATNPDRSAAPYALLNLNFGSRDWPLKGMDITFKVFNLTDARIRDPGFRNADGFFFPSAHPQPRRYFGWEITHVL